MCVQARLWACGCRDVSTPSFGSHLNPIWTRGADYAHPVLVFTPSFESHRRAWCVGGNSNRLFLSVPFFGNFTTYLHKVVFHPWILRIYYRLAPAVSNSQLKPCIINDVLKNPHFSYPVDYKGIESDWYRAFALIVVFWVRDASSRGSLVRKRQLPATCTHSRKGRATVVANG